MHFLLCDSDVTAYTIHGATRSNCRGFIRYYFDIGLGGLVEIFSGSSKEYRFLRRAAVKSSNHRCQSAPRSLWSGLIVRLQLQSQPCGMIKER
jgi:hypothetical protein